MLDSDEAKHSAAMAAASGRVVGPSLPSGPSLAIRPPPGPTKRDEDEAGEEEEYDPMLARELKAAAAQEAGARSGKAVEVNDDGEVVDKRTLLRAGLNITKKPAAAPSSLLSGQRSKPEADQPYVSRAVGTAASYKERMERERRRLAEQVREQEERRRARERQEQEEAEERARRRREGADGEAEKRRQDARERFLARKREREAAKEGANKKQKDN